ncbi:conserved hypothetical protein [Hyphomicrobiales bacterium]|nr:conserved hypothetical protein [Hyphomicrobiales bacterium]CAH1663902.1 conserved hypothetical protein [Hyphomicrobiales bacterium]
MDMQRDRPCRTSRLGETGGNPFIIRLSGSMCLPWLAILAFALAGITAPAQAAACIGRLSDVAEAGAACGQEARLADVAQSGPASGLRDLSLAEIQTTPVGETRFGVEIVTRLGAQTVSPADLLWFQAAFVEGDLGAGPIARPTSVRAIQAELPQALPQAESWSVSGGFIHHWWPNLRHAIFTSLVWQAPPRIALRAQGDDQARLTLGTGTRLTWSPVADMDLGLEVLYTRSGEFVSRRVGFKDLAMDGTIDARLRFNKGF